MIDATAVDSIIAMYEKHGWVLRRLLLTGPLLTALGPRDFGGVALMESSIDAAWFSRPGTGGTLAWELRYLGNVPFSLVEYVDEDDAAFETALGVVENRLRASISSKRAA